MNNQYQYHNPIKFVLNKDGQLTVQNPFDVFNNYQTIQQNSIKDALSTPIDTVNLNPTDILNDFYKKSINDPVKGFFARNDVNLVVFFLGILMLIVGVLETGVL